MKTTARYSKRRFVFFIAVLILLLAGLALHSKLNGHTNNDEFPFTEQYDLNGSEYHGHSKLTVNKHFSTGDREIMCKIDFLNIGGNGATFYNPFYNSLFDMPVKLAVHNARKKYLCDLFADRSGSFVGGGDPIEIPAGGNVGVSINVSMNHFSPGLYYLQVIYLKSFVIAHDNSSYFREHGGEELFRSDFVRIIVL